MHSIMSGRTHLARTRRPQHDRQSSGPEAHIYALQYALPLRACEQAAFHDDAHIPQFDVDTLALERRLRVLDLLLAFARG